MLPLRFVVPNVNCVPKGDEGLNFMSIDCQVANTINQASSFPLGIFAGFVAFDFLRHSCLLAVAVTLSNHTAITPLILFTVVLLVEDLRIGLILRFEV